jgi:hypothetical protein
MSQSNRLRSRTRSRSPELRANLGLERRRRASISLSAFDMMKSYSSDHMNSDRVTQPMTKNLAAVA